MRLSEAMRLGAMLGPQASGDFYRNGAMCAQGAALAAVGVQLSNTNISNSRHYHDEFARRFPWAKERVATCPACHALIAERLTVRELIPHLNNRASLYGLAHGWTRERIADWIETLEREDGLVDAAVPTAATDAAVHV